MQQTRFGKLTLWYRNSAEFHLLKREIFSHEVYACELEALHPLIIDAGAHIGLATAFFKQLWPTAQVIAIEPLTASREILEKNIWENGFRDVTVIPAALCGDRTRQTVLLHADASDNVWLSTAGVQQGAWNGEQTTAAVEVPAVTLSSLLQGLSRPVDLLKLDIEGSELEVLREASASLPQIRHIILEFHPTAGQKLSELIQLLIARGFVTSVWKDGKAITVPQARGLVYVHADRR